MSTLSELEYYCHEENSFGALMFTGEWGCGKTYLIEHELADRLGEGYIIIRISLFGESSVDSINRKVQKAYFQEVMLNMGGNVEELVKVVPGVTDEKASQIGDGINKVAGKFEDISDKLNKSKFGKFVRFASEMAKKIPGADKILALNPSECIPIEASISDKKVILVFDDLERSTLDEVAVLGCINEYCENKHIKTIIVANEEKILEKYFEQEADGNQETGSDKTVHTDAAVKIKYSEIKEKIVVRTIKNIPDYKSIFTKIITDYNTQDEEYKNFLIENKMCLVNVFTSGSNANIRSIKCAIQDFQRVFNELRRKGIEDDLLLYFQTFVAYTLLVKTGKVYKSERYGYLFCDSEIEKEYPGYYVSRYMLPGIREWLIEGEWNEKSICDDIEKMLEVKKDAEPKDLVRNLPLIDLEEDTIKKGLPEVLEMAYAGNLDIDDYITLLTNMYWARTITYELPEKPDMKKLEAGVEQCLENVCNSDEPDTRVRKMISPNDMNLLSEDEKRIYMKICYFRDMELQMFAINRRKYLRALRSGKMNEIYECENKRFNIFDDEMALAVADCFKTLPNSERPSFTGVYYKMWNLRIGSQDLLIKESIPGLMKLKERLSQIKIDEEGNGYGLKAALTKNFMQDVEEIAKKMKEKLGEMVDSKGVGEQV